MFGWIARLFDRRCKFFDICKLKQGDSETCRSGPTYFDGIDTKSFCGHYRILDNWPKPDWSDK
jgi:hypothetical protein